MVTGGYDGFRLDTTEVYKDSVWRIVAGKLPVAIWNLSATTISNRVLLFGKNNYYMCGFFLIWRFLGGDDGSSRNDILEYSHETEEWQEIGTMKEPRRWHAVTVVSYEEYAEWCN